MLCLSCCLFVSGLFTPLPGLSTFMSLSASSMHVLKLFTPFPSDTPMPGSSAPLSSSCHLSIPGLSAPLSRLSAPLSPFTYGMCVLGSSALSMSRPLIPRSSTPPSPSGQLPIPGSFAFLSRLSTLLSLSAFGMYIAGLSALSISSMPVAGFFASPSPSSCLLMSGLSASPPELSAILSPSASGVHMPGLSTLSMSGCLLVPGSFLSELSPLFPNWLSQQTLTPVPGKQ